MHATLPRQKGQTMGGRVGDGDNPFEGLGGDHGRESAALLNTAEVGLWALLATLSMLFAGFTSAYLVRQAGPDWAPINAPPILWFNTALLLSSSVTLEAARTRMRRRRREALKRWLLVTALLGLSFLFGQFLAWRQLAAQGVFLSTNPHSSFFYMLTGIHAVHLLGGIFALLYALNASADGRPGWAPAQPTAINLCATYWHFVDGLWVYLFFLIFVL